MASPRFVLPGRFVVFLVSFGTLASPARAEEKSAVDNAKARVAVARKIYQGLVENLKQKESPEPQLLDLEKFYLWSRRWMNAQREIAEKKEDRIAAVEAHLGRMKELEGIMKELYETEQIAVDKVWKGEFYRLEAERSLLEAKKK